MQVDVDFNYDQTKYDEANALVLPAQSKKPEVKKNQKVKKVVQLSKKELKKRAKIAARKEKKLNVS